MNTFSTKYLPIFLSFVLLATAGFFWLTPPAMASVALVTSGHASAGGQLGTATTGSLNTTGATLLVAIVVDYDPLYTSTTISDSKGNTWHALTSHLGGTQTRTQMYYAYNHGGSALSVGSGHTVSASGAYTGLTVLVFSGTQTSADPFDQQNGAGTAGSSLSTGSITPSGDNEVIVTGEGSVASGTFSISNGITTVTDTAPYSASVNMGSAGAYTVQTSAGAINPTWAYTASTDMSNTIASFKAAATSVSAASVNVSLAPGVNMTIKPSANLTIQ